VQEREIREWQAQGLGTTELAGGGHDGRAREAALGVLSHAGPYSEWLAKWLLIATGTNLVGIIMVESWS
jgi:hypothetical protein